MYSDPSLQGLIDLFADRISHDPDVRQTITNVSAPLPSEQMKRIVSNLARWLLAVARTSSVRAATDIKAMDRAVKTEGSRYRMLLEDFSQDSLRDLRNRTAEAVGNALFLGNVGALAQLNSFLTAQTRRHVAPVDRQQMFRAS